MSLPTTKYSHTKLREYTHEVEVSPYKNGLSATFPDGEYITSNFTFFTEKERKKLNLNYFILDKEDIPWLTKQWAKDSDKAVKCAKSLRNFMKQRKEKRIYLRGFPIEDGENKVFKFIAKEVYEIISIINGTRWDSLLAGEDNNEILYPWIDIEELKQNLEECNINKDLITIVPDISYEYNTQKHILENDKNSIGQCPDGLNATYPSNAVFIIFQRFVHGVKWNKDYCTLHPNCTKDFKNRILSVMNNYANIDQPVLVSLERVNTDVCKLTTHCTYKYQIDDLVNLDLLDLSEYNDLISKESYKKLCLAHSIPSELIDIFYKKEDSVPVWAARMLYSLQLILLFTYSNMNLLDKALVDALTIRVPPSLRNVIKENMINKLFCDETESGSEYFDEKEKAAEKEEEKENSGSAATIDHFEKMRQDAERRKQEVQEKKHAKKNKGGKNKNLVPKESMSTKRVSNKTVQKLNDMETISESITRQVTDMLFEGNETLSDEELTKKLEAFDVSLLCEKSVNLDASIVKVLTSSMDEIKAEIFNGMRLKATGKNQDSKPEIKLSTELKQKDNQKTDKNNETKKESITKIEPTIQKKEEKSSSNESKSCPKCLRTSERCSDAQRELKTAQNKLKTIEDKARKFDEIEKKMKEMTKENDELNKINSQQAKEIESLKLKGSKEGEKLKGENKKLTDYIFDLEAQLKREQQKTNALEQEIAQLRQKLENDQMDFATKLSQLEVEISSNGATIEELRTKNPTSSAPSSSTGPSTSSRQSTSTRATSDYESYLTDFQNLQNGVNDGSVMREAEGMVEHLIILANQPEIHQLARDELTQLATKIENYSRAVKKNIWILERTRNSSKLECLPERPSLSDRFMAEYRMAVNNQQYSETECQLCSYELTPKTETSKCEKCKKIDCAKCISKWLKNHSTCPHCRAPRLDENEFPALG